MEYNRKNPYQASVKERYSLCKNGSTKDIQHIVIDLEGSGIRYRSGDSIGVMPLNPLNLVENTLRAMGATGEERVNVKGDDFILRDFLSKKANLSTVPKKVVKVLLERQTDSEKKERLAYLLEDRDAFKAYQENHEIWDALEENREVEWDLQELCGMMMPLLPRLYSIASSMNEVGNEVHLTIAKLEYESNGHSRVGICTNYLCDLAPIEVREVPIYIQPTKDFLLPEDTQVPVIMIGPGTGIAPFRAFMQDRVANGGSGSNWLFFGEWNREYHFFYEEFWNELVERGVLRLETAFSRDQGHKVYVQNRMLEHGEELYRWLRDGAYLYVCGDAQKMAKDVETAILQIVEKYGEMDESCAKEYMKQLRKEKRYLRDVY